MSKQRDHEEDAIQSVSASALVALETTGILAIRKRLGATQKKSGGRQRTVCARAANMERSSAGRRRENARDPKKRRFVRGSGVGW